MLPRHDVPEMSRRDIIKEPGTAEAGRANFSEDSALSPAWSPELAECRRNADF